MLLEINNDKKYGSDVIALYSTSSLGNYMLVDKGDVVLKALGMDLQAGRFLPVDEVDSPYSLVFNPNALASDGVKFSYSAGPFTYSTEWVQLSYQSDFGSVSATPPAWQYVWNGTAYTQTGTGFPDRGTDVHNFLFRSGEWRFGFQDQSVYSGRSFDPEYFFSPMPQYFTEYLHSVSGRPWTAENQLDKYMMGFFGTWKEGGSDLCFQFQMADFNLHFLNVFVGSDFFPNNPAKFAWSVGGHWTNDWGRWGLFHAGATKYMYEAMTVAPGQETVRDVGNFYFPDTVYNLNGSFVPIDLQTNEIGYTHGENNLALMLTWDQAYLQERLHLGGTLELVLAGANGPANPWQGETSVPSSSLGTQLLGDPVWEKTIQASWRADLAVDSWTFSLGLTVGEIFNVLALENAPDYALGAGGTESVLTTLIQNWVPSGQNQGIFTLNLGVKYFFDVSPYLVAKD